MRQALRDWLSTGSEPLTRVELWLGLVTLYLVLGAYAMGYLTSQFGTAEKTAIAPISNRA
jgi:hypothetical protein